MRNENLRLLKPVDTLTGMSEDGSENSLKGRFKKTAAVAAVKVGLLAGATLMGGSGDNVDNHVGNVNTNAQENHQSLTKPELSEFAVNPDFVDFKNVIDGALDQKGLPGFFNRLNQVVQLNNNDIANFIKVEPEVNTDGEIIGKNYFFNKNGFGKDKDVPNDLIVMIANDGPQKGIITRVSLNIDTVGLRDQTAEDTLSNVNGVLIKSELDSKNWDRFENIFRRSLVEGDRLEMSQTIDLDKGSLEIGATIPENSPFKPHFNMPLRETPKISST